MLRIETVRSVVYNASMISFSIHNITSLSFGEIDQLKRGSWSRVLTMRGTNAHGDEITVRLPLFGQSRDALTLDPERALLGQRLDEIIACVKEIE